MDDSHFCRLESIEVLNNRMTADHIISCIQIGSIFISKICLNISKIYKQKYINIKNIK